MKIAYKSKLLLILSLFALIFLISTTVLVNAATHTVDDDGPADFATIQAAVDAADKGDTIQVYAGTYNENVFIDSKSLEIFGDNKKSWSYGSGSVFEKNMPTKWNWC